MTARYTKCYLIQIFDDNGNEVDSEYSIGDMKAAKANAAWLKQYAEKYFTAEGRCGNDV